MEDEEYFLKVKQCTTFEDSIKLLIEYYKRKDLHINDGDTRSCIRMKDINFGKLIAYENILRKWECSKSKETANV